VLFIHKQMLLLQRMTNLEEKTRQRSEVVDASAVLPTKLRYYDGGLESHKGGICFFPVQ